MPSDLSHPCTFASRWLQSEEPPRAQLQAHYLQWLAGLVTLSMVLIVFRLTRGEGLLSWAAWSFVASAVLAWIVTTVQLRARVACVVVTGSAFQLRTLYGMAMNEPPGGAFPLQFAAPVLQGDTLHIHYLDRVVSLQRKDFAEFDRLLDCFRNPPQPDADAPARHNKDEMV